MAFLLEVVVRLTAIIDSEKGKVKCAGGEKELGVRS